MCPSEAGGPVTVITGGGTGIGAAVAGLLAARGHRVVIAGRRREPLATVAARTGAVEVAVDAATEAGAGDLVAVTLEKHGRIDGLVLNAGILEEGTVEELSPERWDEVIRINLSGPFLLIRAALASLRDSRGSIVAVSSIAAMRSGPRMSAYAASKAALVSLVRGVAVDHAGEGIRANCVCPGWVKTEMSDREMEAAASHRGTSVADAYAAATALVPQRRAAEAAEVAGAVAWLLSDEASYVTGASLVIDGGTVLVDAGNVASEGA